MSTLKSKPVLSASVVTALAGAILALLATFGLPITEAQTVAVLGVISIVAPFGVAALADKKVLSFADVDAGYVHKADVVEYAQDGIVLAGEASEFDTDTQIRELGSLREVDGDESH